LRIGVIFYFDNLISYKEQLENMLNYIYMVYKDYNYVSKFTFKEWKLKKTAQFKIKLVYTVLLIVISLVLLFTFLDIP